MPSPLEEKFAALRDATRRFGVVHEEQLVQLRCWPVAIVRGCDLSEAEVDVDARSVKFRLRFKSSKSKQPPKAHLRRLGEAVAWLFGPAWGTEISEIGEGLSARVIYSAPGAGPAPAQFSGTDFDAGKVVPDPWPFLKTPSPKIA